MLKANRSCFSGYLTLTCAAILAVSLPVAAQTAATPVTPTDEGPVILSAFEVSSTQSKGYTSSNAATGFKTNESLLRIPQAVTLVTRDLIDDIGAVDSSTILQYSGVSNFFVGESFAIRGTRVGYPLLDEMPDGMPFADNINIDSYTVLRGPAATLYLNSSLGGTVLTTSKQPLPQAMHRVTYKMDEHGQYRAEVDVTGPIGTLGDVKFSYRVVAAVQSGDHFFRNVEDERTVIHPSLQAVYKNTVVRLGFDYQQMTHNPNGASFVTPTGELYTGAGRDEAYYPPGNMENFHRRGVRFSVIQKLTDNWDMKVSATRWWYSRLGSNVLPGGGVNWPNQTITFTARKNDQGADYTVAQIDVNGRYKLVGIPMQTTFGSSYSAEDQKNRVLGFPAGVFPSKTVPIANPGMNSIVPPALSLFNAAGPGSGSMTYRGNGYIQQTVDVIPERLILVGGLTYSKIKINNISNLATRAIGSVVDGDANLHRYGAVFNVTKDFALYAMESTTFTPTANRDINLNTLQPAEGTGREVGFKTAFNEGRISTTFAVFDLELSNQAFFAGIRPDGISYFAPIGSTTQKGYDFDIAYSPLPNLQIIGTYYNGKVRDQAGNKVANSYSKHISLVGRYEFTDGAAKGLSLGAGFSRIGGRLLATGAYVTGVPGLTLIEAEPGNAVNLFATYKLGRNWLLRANVDNLLDEAYVLGAQNAYLVDPSLPRTISASVTYKF